MQAAQSAQKKLIQRSFTKDLFTDTGNIPLVLANSAGASLVLFFGGRKLFYHPDISVSDELRNSNVVQNETATRLTDADAFRSQTAAFASWIEPKALPVVAYLTGSKNIDEVSSKWNLSFTKHKPVDLTPLERTNYFDDDLYAETEPQKMSNNEETQTYHALNPQFKL